VIRGPFDMWEGRIERLDSHGRLRVLLDVLSRQVPVELDETQIEPV
jgi:transcriptional antiterminator NusG